MIHLFALITVQVICFQFLMHYLIRLLPEQLLGKQGHPPEVAAELAAFRKQQGRLARVLGIVLLLAALLVTFMLPLGSPGMRKLALAAVSLGSSLIMLLGYIGDGKRMLAIGKRLPESGARTAALQRRRIAEVYPAALELLPPLLFLATLFLTLNAGGIGRTPLIVILLCQLGFVVASHFFARWLVAQRLPMLPSALALQEDGAEAIAAGRRFRHQDLRYFLVARIVIVFLLGFMQVQQIAEMRREILPYWLAMGDRIIVVLLLAGFATHLLQLSRWRRGERTRVTNREG
jgi:hypothetical protein